MGVIFKMFKGELNITEWWKDALNDVEAKYPDD